MQNPLLVDYSPFCRSLKIIRKNPKKCQKNQGKSEKSTRVITARDQPHEVMTGSQNHNTFEFDLHIDHTYSPTLE